MNSTPQYQGPPRQRDYDITYTRPPLGTPHVTNYAFPSGAPLVLDNTGWNDYALQYMAPWQSLLRDAMQYVRSMPRSAPAPAASAAPAAPTVPASPATPAGTAGPLSVPSAPDWLGTFNFLPENFTPARQPAGTWNPLTQTSAPIALPWEEPATRTTPLPWDSPRASLEDVVKSATLPDADLLLSEITRAALSDPDSFFSAVTKAAQAAANNEAIASSLLNKAWP